MVAISYQLSAVSLIAGLVRLLKGMRNTDEGFQRIGSMEESS